MKMSKIVIMALGGVSVLASGASAGLSASMPPAVQATVTASLKLPQPDQGPFLRCPLIDRIPQPECLPGTVPILDPTSCSWRCGPWQEPPPLGPRPDRESRSLTPYAAASARISKAVGEGDISQAAEKLGKFFENSSGRPAASDDAPVSFEGGSSSARAGGSQRLGSPSPSRSVDAVYVPAPKGGGRESSGSGLPFGAAGASFIAAVALLFGGRRREGLVLVSDEHTDPNSRRNNPQHDPDVARGWQQNQDDHRHQQNDNRNTTSHDFDVHKSGPGATSGGTEH